MYTYLSNINNSYTWLPGTTLTNSSGYPLPASPSTFSGSSGSTISANEKSRPLAADAGAISLFYQLK
jgi:hypothetical protein